MAVSLVAISSLAGCKKEEVAAEKEVVAIEEAEAAPAEEEAAQDVKTGDKPYSGVEITVIAQRTPAWESIDDGLPAFQEETGMKVSIQYFEELDRRSKTRMDSSTGAGAYDVYYVDEANISEFVNADWLVPLLDYYPEKYDYNDFYNWMRNVGSIDGVPYYAPTFGGGDFMFYRKDVLEKESIPVPTNLDELLEAVKKVNNPPDMYGFVTRGLRGSGANVWRWQDYFKAFGGEWLDENGAPTFNSPAAVKATQYYMELLKYSPPGTTTSTFVDNIEAFRAGKVAFFIDGDVFYDWMEDETKSEVVGLVGYLAPPVPLPSGAYTHGLAISAIGAETEIEKEAAGEFIGWATSKEMEMIRLKSLLIMGNRASTLNSPEAQEIYPKEVLDAIEARGEVTEITFMRIPEWPGIGDYLGIVLEEIFTGNRTDIQAALDEAVKNAEDLLSK